jgi:hypothetical protein
MINRGDLYYNNDIIYDFSPLWFCKEKNEWFRHNNSNNSCEPFVLLQRLTSGVSYVEGQDRNPDYDRVFKYEFWNALDENSNVKRIRIDYYLGTWGTLYGTEDNNFRGRKKSELSRHSDNDLDIQLTELEMEKLQKDKFLKVNGKEIY